MSRLGLDMARQYGWEARDIRSVSQRDDHRREDCPPQETRSEKMFYIFWKLRLTASPTASALLDLD